jgi:hypothetical protein
MILTPDELRDFQDKFGNSFATVYMIVQNMLVEDPRNQRLNVMFLSLNNMREVYFKTFSGELKKP